MEAVELGVMVRLVNRNHDYEGSPRRVDLSGRLERGTETRRRLDPDGLDAGCLGAHHEVGPGGKLGGDDRSLGPLLDPLHPAERAVVKDHPGDGQPLLYCRPKFMQLHLERAVTCRADDLAIRPCQLRRHRADDSVAHGGLFCGRYAAAGIEHLVVGPKVDPEMLYTITP